MMTGLVSRLMEHSFVDGPGNRAVAFFQGCHLRCLYCHNPQTWSICEGCGLCLSGCPGEALAEAGTGQPLRWDPARCQGCDQCIAVCPSHADPRSQALTVQQLMVWLAPLRPFISGVTASGGEPLLQAPFVAAWFAAVQRKGLSTMVETSAALDWNESFAPVLPVLNGALVDLKVWEPSTHVALTGRTNAETLENLRRLAHLGKLTEVRVPVIPGYSDTIENMAATAAFVADLDPAVPLRLQRFRPHGTAGEARSWIPPSDERMDALVAVARSAGLQTVSRSR